MKIAGHEVIGEVVEMGSEVKDFKIGDRVGFGAQGNSCQNCEFCNQAEESICGKVELLFLPPKSELLGFFSFIR